MNILSSDQGVFYGFRIFEVNYVGGVSVGLDFVDVFQINNIGFMGSKKVY